MDIFITGGASGIGEQISRTLLSKEHRVLICYNSSEKNAQKLKARFPNAEIFKADLADREQAAAFFEYGINTFGGIDALINCAGVALKNCFQCVSDGEFDRLMAINFNSVYKLCSLAVPHFLAKGDGNIINIASMWGVKPASCEALYSASKAAVISLTQAMAAELGSSGIRVNCISPGVIDTKMNSALTAEDMERLKQDTPLERIGSAEDVANAVEFLLSPKASFITGQNLIVDGGYLL